MTALDKLFAITMPLAIGLWVVAYRNKPTDFVIVLAAVHIVVCGLYWFINRKRELI